MKSAFKVELEKGDHLVIKKRNQLPKTKNVFH